MTIIAKTNHLYAMNYTINYDNSAYHADLQNYLQKPKIVYCIGIDNTAANPYRRLATFLHKCAYNQDNINFTCNYAFRNSLKHTSENYVYMYSSFFPCQINIIKDITSNLYCSKIQKKYRYYLRRRHEIFVEFLYTLGFVANISESIARYVML